MASQLVATPEIQALLDRVSGLQEAGGDARAKQIMRKIVSDLYSTIDDFDISPDEFWAAIGFLQAGVREYGLIAPGFGFDHFLDVRMDIADKAAGLDGGTPRTIEGPLYVAGAPTAKGHARLDDGTDKGTTLIVQGQVRDMNGKPVSGAMVDVWHANTLGNYSHFDPSQTPFNNRRRIEADADGRYKFQTIIPSGYSVPAQGATELLLAQVGREDIAPPISTFSYPRLAIAT